MWVERRGVETVPRNISRKWQITIAFFLGSAVSVIVYDFSDYFFYRASANGALNASQQAFYFTWVAALFYFGLGGLAYLMARTGFIKPVGFMYFFVFLLVASWLLGLGLPQASNGFWLFTATAGLIVGAGIALGVAKKLGGRSGLSKVNGAFFLLFALIIFILLSIVPTMSVLGSVPPIQVSSSPSFILGVLALLGITGYVLVKWRKAR